MLQPLLALPDTRTGTCNFPPFLLGCQSCQQFPWIPFWPVQPLVPISSPKNPQGKRAPGRACPCWEGDTAEPFLGTIQGCSQWEQWDPGAALMGGAGWEWGSLSQERLECSLKMKVLAQPGESPVPAPSLEMVSLELQGWLQLFPWSRSHNSRGRWSLLLLLRLRGWIRVLPLLPRDGVTWSGSQGCWGPVWCQLGGGMEWDQLGQEGQGSIQVGQRRGSCCEDTDPSRCPQSAPGRGR